MERTEARRAIEAAIEAAIRSHAVSSVEAVNIAKAAAMATNYEMTQETARQVYGSR